MKGKRPNFGPIALSGMSTDGALVTVSRQDGGWVVVPPSPVTMVGKKATRVDVMVGQRKIVRWLVR